MVKFTRTNIRCCNNSSALYNSLKLLPHFSFLIFLVLSNTLSWAQKTSTPKASLEQIRNGSATSPLATGAWVAGSLNASQAHFAENWSIPYRLVITGLTKVSDLTKPHSVIIEWDTRHSDKNALDFITHYNNIDFAQGTHFFNFNHNPELINPTDGYNNLSTDFAPIPPPPVPGDPNGTGDNPAKTFKALQSIQKDRMYIFGGSNITFGAYTSTATTMQLEIKFINPNSTTVILAWGGHIAYFKDYAGNSASTISGSPYHMRLVSLNGGGGNQDRALSADAVADPPACTITGPASVECKTTNTYTAKVDNYDPNLSYEWVVYDITKTPPVVLQTQTATISNGSSSFNYTAGTCGANYRVAFVIKKAGNPLPSCAPVDVTVVDSKAPTWTTEANALDVTLECDDADGLKVAQAVTPEATDNCATPALTKTSGEFKAGSCAQAGTYTNTWVAKDACGNVSATYTQIITIKDTKAPTWTTLAGALDKTLECNDAAGLAAAQALAPVATDNCDITLVPDKTTGSFKVGSCPQAGTYTNTWIVKDDCGNTSAVYTQVITIQDTKAPIWSTQAGALNKTVECDNKDGLTAAQALAPEATDNCGKVTYEKTAGSFVASESCPQGGTITNTWVAKDECGNQTGEPFTQVITIQDTKAPTWTTAAGALNKTIECNDAVGLAAAQALAPEATDNCGKVTYEKTSGTFEKGTCPQAGTYTNTWVAKDECGNTSAVYTQVITIKDSKAPEIKVQAAGETVECDGQGNTVAFESWLAANGGASATDACSPVSWSNNYNVGNWVVDCGNAKHISVTFTAKDECGNTASTSATFTIQDKTGPKLEGCPQDRTIECLNELNTVANVTALDACSGSLPVTFTQTESNKGNACSNTITRIWEAKDACGNISSCKQVITLVDKTAPAIVCPPDIQLPCSLNEPTKEQAGAPTVYDFCDAAPTVTYKDVVSGTGCSRTITRTWTATDASQNKSSCIQIITFTNTNTLVQQQTGNQSIAAAKPAEQRLQVEQPASDIQVKAFPNPYFSSVNFQFVSPSSGKATLEIYDLMGRKLAVAYEGQVQAGVPVSFTYNIAAKHHVPMVYKLNVGERSSRGKLLPSPSRTNHNP
jgi:hypothetical protein